MHTAETPTKVGNLNANYNLGWTNNFTYKGINLGVVLSARVGGLAYSATQGVLDYYGVSSITANARDNKGVPMNNGKVDTQKFKELLEFGEGNEYIPFAYGKNSEQERKTVTMPLPDDKQRLIFYRESKDGCFCSYRGSHFYVVDGQLYLTYQYQRGTKEWIATPVPEALSNYFCELVKNFDEINKETATNEGKSTKS